MNTISTLHIAHESVAVLAQEVMVAALFFCSGLIFTKGVSPISQPAPVGGGIKQRPTAPHRQTKEL